LLFLKRIGTLFKSQNKCLDRQECYHKIEKTSYWSFPLAIQVLLDSIILSHTSTSPYLIQILQVLKREILYFLFNKA